MQQNIVNSYDDVCRLISSINLHPRNQEELYSSLRILSRINASAYKGHGELSREMKKLNDLVYRTKNELLPVLFEAASAMKCDIGYNSGILYYRHSNGVQLSYHYSSELNSKLAEIHFTNERPEWDHVRNSWEYDDPEQYQRAIELYWKKYSAAKNVYIGYISMIFDELLDLLRSGARRRALGFDQNIAWFRANKRELDFSPSRYDMEDIRDWYFPDNLSSYFLCDSSYRADQELFYLVATNLGFRSVADMQNTMCGEILDEVRGLDKILANY